MIVKVSKEFLDVLSFTDKVAVEKCLFFSGEYLVFTYIMQERKDTEIISLGISFVGSKKFSIDEKEKIKQNTPYVIVAKDNKNKTVLIEKRQSTGKCECITLFNEIYAKRCNNAEKDTVTIGIEAVIDDFVSILQQITGANISVFDAVNLNFLTSVKNGVYVSGFNGEIKEFSDMFLFLFTESLNEFLICQALFNDVQPVEKKDTKMIMVDINDIIEKTSFN